MAKEKIVIHDVATGQVIEREMTADELAQLAVDKAETAAYAAEQATKAALRQATLDKLGLTTEEIAALLS
jgi:hypothetical protein